MSEGARRSVRDPGRQVVELGYGILVYPPERPGSPWRATFIENGRRRYQQAVSEEKLAAKLEKVTERLQVGAPNMELTGADLIAYYLDPDRLPADRRWSRKHADTQRRLCERLAAPVIDMVTCQDITPWHMQQIVNAAPTAGEGARVAAMISVLVGAGIDGGYLANPRLAKVHWQAAGQTVAQCCIRCPMESFCNTSLRVWCSSPLLLVDGLAISTFTCTGSRTGLSAWTTSPGRRATRPHRVRGTSFSPRPVRRAAAPCWRRPRNRCARPGSHRTPVGQVVLTSDAVHDYEELERDRQFAIVASRADMYTRSRPDPQACR